MRSGKIPLSLTLAMVFLVIGLFAASPARSENIVSICVNQYCQNKTGEDFRSCASTCPRPEGLVVLGSTYVACGICARNCIEGNDPDPYTCLVNCDVVCP